MNRNKTMWASMQSDRSTIWVTWSPYLSHAKEKLNRNKILITKRSFKIRGIDPHTSCMLSEHSTIRATSPQFLYHKTLNFSSSIIVKMKNYLEIIYLVIDSFGEVRYRSHTSHMGSSTIWATSARFWHQKTLISRHN